MDLLIDIDEVEPPLFSKVRDILPVVIIPGTEPFIGAPRRVDNKAPFTPASPRHRHRKSSHSDALAVGGALLFLGLLVGAANNSNNNTDTNYDSSYDYNYDRDYNGN